MFWKKVEEIDPIKEAKREERKRKWEENTQRVIDWCCYHPVITLSIISGTTAILKTAIKSTGQAIAAHQDKVHTDLKVYNRSSGMYDTIKRPLTVEQRIELDRRHNQGETTTQILADMGLLK